MDKEGFIYDMILMDHMMPGMDGIETMKEIRNDESYANIPIIVLTANALRGMREYYLEQGFTDFIAKPADQQTLNEVIGKWLIPGNRDTELKTAEHGLADNGINSVFSGEIVKQRIDKLNHLCAGFEIGAFGEVTSEKIDDEYKKCCNMLRSCCEEFKLWVQNCASLDAHPEAEEIVQRLQKAILDGDTETTGKTLKELGTAAMTPEEREKYFNIYDALMDDNKEKAVERIKEWLE
jgi:CheY-like chemotaxis protein